MGCLIRFISAYRVSQDSPAQAGETTACKQRTFSLMLSGENKSNPKKQFLKNLTSMLTVWRAKNFDSDVITMADMNEFIGKRKDC